MIGSTFRWLGGATAILSLAAVAYQLWSIYSVHLEARAYVANLVATAERQRELDDLLRAWETLDEALEIERSFVPARELQIAVASQLVRGTLKVSRSKQRGYGRISGTTWYGGDLDQVYAPVERVLYRASASPDPQQAADALAHLAWRILAVGKRKGADPLIERALLLDPENPYALVAARHQLLIDEDLAVETRLAGSRPLLAQAYAGLWQRTRDEQGVRRFVETMEQTSLLMPQELELSIEALRLADQALLAGRRPSSSSRKSYLDVFELLAYLPVDGSASGYPELTAQAERLVAEISFDRLSAILAWLDASAPGSSEQQTLGYGSGNRHDDRELDLLAARAVLLEREGETEAARALYAVVISQEHLAPLASGALERLGPPAVSAGPTP